MANNISNVSFASPAYDYGGELSEIERQRKLADALRAAGMAPGRGTQMAGNIAIRESPLAGVAKVAQSLSGEYVGQQAKERQAALTKRSQDDLTKTLTDAMRAYQGSPATAEVPMPSDEAGGGPGRAAAPAVAGDPMQAAMMMMRNPQTAPMAGGMFTDAMKSQRLAQVLAGAGFGGSGVPMPAAGQAPQGAPAGATSAPSPGAAPMGNPAQQGVPSGVNPLAWALAKSSGDIPGLAKMVQNAHIERNKPIVARENAPVLERGPDGKLAPSFYAPKMEAGVQPQFGPGGVTGVTAVPNYNNVRADTIAAEERAKQGVQAGFDLVDVPDGRGGTKKIPRSQALQLLSGQQRSQPMLQPPQGVTPLTQAPSADAARQAAMEADARNMPVNVAGPATAGAPLAPSQGGALPPPIPGLGVPQLAPAQPVAPFGSTQNDAEKAAERERLLAQTKRAEDVPQARAAAQSSIQGIERLNNIAGELHDHKGLNSIVGKVNQYSALDLSTETRAARGLQHTMVSQVGVNALQAMRDASKTGGAVGAVTEKEWPILQQSIAALDGAQGTKDYQKALKNLQSQITASSARIKAAYEGSYGLLNYKPVEHTSQGRSTPRRVVDW